MTLRPCAPGADGKTGSKLTFQIPPAALCAVAGALALAGCQGKAPADQAEAVVDPTIAAAVSQTTAAPAFAAPPAPGVTTVATPPSTLGEPTAEGLRSTFKIVPAAPAPGGAEATVEAGGEGG